MRYLIIIAVSLLVAGVLSEQEKIFRTSNPEVEDSNKLTPSVVIDAQPGTVEDSYEKDPEVTDTPSQITSTPQFGIYNYPNSKIVSSGENNLLLKSKDSPDKITNWYREVVENQNMNIISFVNTKANDRVLNKISATKETLGWK